MNFQEFEKLINAGAKEITLNEDVILDRSEAENYKRGIEINTDDLTIEGNCHAIDAIKKVPLLNVKASNVTLKNISFKNGYCEYSGGAIVNEGHLTIDGCEFIDNSSVDFGGAIYNAPNSKLLIKNSGFEDNRSDYGGAIYIDSGSTLNLEGSVLKSNTSEFEGGAIFNKAKLLIYGSLFGKNASFKGGAIYSEDILNIKDCDFENNIASEGDDIKCEDDNDLTVFNCRFFD